MRVIDYLAGQLDREVMDHELRGGPNIFIQSLDFWMLCVEAKRLLEEEKEVIKSLVNGVKLSSLGDTGYPTKGVK